MKEKNRKMGRPRANPGKLRGFELRIRLAAGELESVDLAANQAKLSRSDYVRKRLGLPVSGYRLTSNRSST